MIFDLCSGDVTKWDVVGNLVSYKQAVKWIMFKNYDSYMEQKLMDESKHGR